MGNNISRRTFLKKSSLVIAATAFSGNINLFRGLPAYAAADPTFKPHAFLEIGEDDTITIWMGQTNLGQGTHTGIPMIIADELDADWTKVEAKMALAADVFKNPHWGFQGTGGSSSIRHRWDLLRKTGAAAREMLVRAAADQWGISERKCATKNSRVFHPDGQSLTYGQLVNNARELPVPENPRLKDPKEYRIIGTKRNTADIPDKVMGKTIYGIDFTVKGMCHAVVARPPRYGAVPKSYDTDAAMAQKGVLKVIPFKDKIAVCADTTWNAILGREALEIKWSTGSHPDLSDAKLETIFNEYIEKPGAVAKNQGDVKKALAESAIQLESKYRNPFLSHAQVEPINCTAHVEPNRCRVWVPTQGQTFAIMTAAAITGLPHEKIEVMTTAVGGGFGVRIEPDPVADAVYLSKQMKRPVKVTWTREDDFANDFFRPASQCIIKAGLDDQGRLTAWSQKVASQSIMSRLAPQYVKNGIDQSSIEGVINMPYSVVNHYVNYVMVDLPIPVGFWRSVGFSINVFTVESFIDEMAHAAGKDPVQFRLDHMQKESRPYNTLKLLAEKAGWSDPVPKGRARGVAVSECFGSSGAHMAEVSVEKNGYVKVHKIVCALDCGPAIHPEAITAQAEGGVIMGMSTAFYERSQFANGGVKTENYNDYHVLTMSDVPEIEIYIAKSKHPIGGIGEPVYPSVAPAIANAVFKASGIRLKQMPFSRKLLAKN